VAADPSVTYRENERKVDQEVDFEGYEPCAQTLFVVLFSFSGFEISELDETDRGQDTHGKVAESSPTADTDTTTESVDSTTWHTSFFDHLDLP